MSILDFHMSLRNFEIETEHTLSFEMLKKIQKIPIAR